MTLFIASSLLQDELQQRYFAKNRRVNVLGILYGALEAGRRNLRINIVAHAFTDGWEGWLKFVVWRVV
jgi:hypothetical protein